MAFQRFIRDKRRFLELNDYSFDSEDNAASGGKSPVAISVPSSQPLQAMNVRRVFTCPLPNGDELTLSVDKERFHACEVLLQASMNSDEGFSHENSIVHTILRAAEAVDESVRADVCGRIVVFGRTALVPGLLARLQADLRDGLARLGVEKFVIAGVEEPTRSEADDDGNGGGGGGGGGDDDDDGDGDDSENDADAAAAAPASSEANGEGGGPLLGGPRGAAFAPSASWRGASERVKWSRSHPPALTLNTISSEDYMRGVALEEMILH
jgi:hypothetical protein